MKNLSKLFLLFFVLIFIFTSCKNQRYLSNNTDFNNINFEVYDVKNIEYKLQPYDYLYVSIKSSNEDINKLYEQISSTFSNISTGNEASFFLTGFLINDSGYVFIPTIGQLYIKGLTIEQTRNLIQNKINEILYDAIVNVRLTSFNVTFIGEFNRTGKISFYKEKVNILEGIGLAGGINDYGNMRKVIILRPTDSVFVKYSLNLTNANILEQKEFYLFPNDIVYIPPKKSKDVVEFFRDYSTILTVLTSTLTTTLLILEFYKK